MYLDEQPVTTIDGNLNIHIYDIERVEALAGPQGTLYGASSQSGTIRIITNKPDPTGFKAVPLQSHLVDAPDDRWMSIRNTEGQDVLGQLVHSANERERADPNELHDARFPVDDRMIVNPDVS